VEVPSPTDPMTDRAALFCAYLDALRGGVRDVVGAMDDAEARRSRLASGWTPLELVRHLTFVERRWLVWGFLGEDVGDPWGDRVDDRWHVDDGDVRDDVLEALRVQGDRTSEIVSSHPLDAVGRPSERWDGEAPPTLERICFHLLQEYARHAGHLDVVAEIAAADR
jgi:Protein of unknown function (DUF664)